MTIDMKAKYHEFMVNWFKSANFNIRMYLQYGDMVYSDGIKKDATRIFHLAKQHLDYVR